MAVEHVPTRPTCRDVPGNPQGDGKKTRATGNLRAPRRKQINAALNAVTLPAIRAQVDPFDARTALISLKYSIFMREIVLHRAREFYEDESAVYEPCARPRGVSACVSLRVPRRKEQQLGSSCYAGTLIKAIIADGRWFLVSDERCRGKYWTLRNVLLPALIVLPV